MGPAVFKTVEGATSSLAGSIPVRLRQAPLRKGFRGVSVERGDRPETLRGALGAR